MMSHKLTNYYISNQLTKLLIKMKIDSQTSLIKLLNNVIDQSNRELGLD